MKQFKFDTPILFMIFNRLKPTMQVFREIRKAKPKQLFIASDGPQNLDEKNFAVQDRIRRILLKALLLPMTNFTTPIQFMINRMKKKGKGEESYQEKTKRYLKGLHDYFIIDEAKRRARTEVKKAPKGIFKMLLVAGAFLAGVIIGYVTQFKKVFMPFTNVFKSAGNGFKKALGKLQKMFPTFSKILKGLGTGFKTTLDSIFKLFTGGFKNLISKVASSKTIKVLQKMFPTFSKMLGGLGKGISTLGKGISKGFNVVKSFASSVGKVFKGGKTALGIINKLPLGGIVKISFKLGRFLGAWLLPLEMAFKAIKGLITGKTIKDKITGFSAGLIQPILAIPEMIGNAILWLVRKVVGEDFLKGFKFDFGIENIKMVLGKVFDFYKNAFDFWVNFFTVTLPAKWDEFKSFLSKTFTFENIKNKLMNGIVSILEVVYTIPEMIGNGILSLARMVFGEDFLAGFKFDFGAENIKIAINKIIDNILTGLDFFMEGLKWIGDKLGKLGGGLLDFL